MALLIKLVIKTETTNLKNILFEKLNIYITFISIYLSIYKKKKREREREKKA
jgi:hypothetical protein